MSGSIRWGWAVLMTGVVVSSSAMAQVTPTAPEFLRPYGIHNFSAHYIDALRTLLDAEKSYEAGDYRRAQRILDALWDQHPVGGLDWWALPRQPFGINLGSPPCYYALRMLTDMTSWRLGQEVGLDRVGDPGPVESMVSRAPRSARFTVIIAGNSEGIQPRNLQELQQGNGALVFHPVDPRILEDDFRVVHESLRLFREYTLSMSRGRLRVETRVLYLPGVRLSVDAHIFGGNRFAAGLVDVAQVWEHVSDRVKEATDWWFLVYPSHVPEQYPEFETTEFVTGGMGTGFDGASPLFIIDDRWLVRKPPHLGAGPYSDAERRAYLPQWLQHEFFHHLFRIHPEFALEETPHQWFDRATWPADFVGIYEPDYYHEALYKRLKSADPPLHARLRYATADAPWEQLRLRDVYGTYQREPVENPWHIGTIATQLNGQLTWTNTANVSWILEPDLGNGALLTGPDCPYYDQPNGTQFGIVLARDEFGDFTTDLAGFTFNGEIYWLQ